MCIIKVLPPWVVSIFCLAHGLYRYTLRPPFLPIFPENFPQPLGYTTDISESVIGSSEHKIICNFDCEANMFLCLKPNVSRRSLAAMFVPAGGVLTDAGETGASCYRGRLLQGHFMQNYHIDAEIAYRSSILIHQRNHWRNKTIDARELFEIWKKSLLTPLKRFYASSQLFF